MSHGCRPAPVAFVYFGLDDALLDHRSAKCHALAGACRAFDLQGVVRKAG